MDGRVNLSIGEAADVSGLSVKTIRYYEEIGLIPKAARTNGGVHTAGHRVYSEADVGRLRFIRHARLFGLGLADIRKLLALADRKGCPGKQPEYREMLGRHLREIDERVRHLRGLRTTIEALMAPARRSKDQKCSWGTCGCMRQAGAARSSSASLPRVDKKGEKHV